MVERWDGDAPELREEIREARGRIRELLGSIILLSVLLGVVVNIGSTLLAQVLDTQEMLLLLVACLGVLLAAALLVLPRLSVTVKEFHEEIEIVLPLLVGPEDVEVIRVTHYQDITETAHAALAKRTAQERKDLAHALQRGFGEHDAAGRQAISAFALELTQFLFAVEMAQSSRRLLGPEALYHKFREVARAQTQIVPSDWQALARQAPGNRYLGGQTQHVPQRVLLPGGIRLMLPEVAPQAFGKSRTRKHTPLPFQSATLLAASAGKDTALGISALVAFSEHRLPATNAPHRGLTARCVLRNARDPWLRDLAAEEEAAAALLNEHGRPQRPPAEGEPDPMERYAQLFHRLYGGHRKPRLLRVFVRFEGAFRIKLVNSDARQRGLYVWGTALSRSLARLDIEHFMATLKELDQKTPKRTF
jgi:hypothetical protein